MMKISVKPAIPLAIIFVCAGLAFSQDQPQAQEASAPPQASSGQPQAPETQWIWGEVASLDAPAKTIVVKYLDYESDQEKELTLQVDDKTTYENVKSMDEIKVKDPLSYERPESVPAPPPPEPEGIPAALPAEQPSN
jgi:hypothetical protein